MVKKNSKFFLNLEKRNHFNKLITTLEVDGKTIKDQLNIAKAQKKAFIKTYTQRN